VKITIELDLSEPQRSSVQELARRYRHGWHMADLIVRKDAVERRYEADWVQQVLRALLAETEKEPESA
jgi:hypothetical protein